jgi:ferredoxin-NADP reductase
MEEYKVKIIDIENVTHNVRSLRFEKPKGFSFIPGQATDVSINKPDIVHEKRPFTFTSLNAWDYLELTIKIYNDHNGVTKRIGELKPGDELIISEPWGTIGYKSEGTFIAGGAGITPFIAILRDLQHRNAIGKNKLIFANNTEADIMRREELEKILGNNFINILSHEKNIKYAYGIITETFLKSVIDKFDKLFYLCGPPPLMDSVEKVLSDLGVQGSRIVKEQF